MLSGLNENILKFGAYAPNIPLRVHTNGCTLYRYMHYVGIFCKVSRLSGRKLITCIKHSSQFTGCPKSQIAPNCACQISNSYNNSISHMSWVAGIYDSQKKRSKHIKLNKIMNLNSKPNVYVEISFKTKLLFSCINLHLFKNKTLYTL